MSQLSIDTNDSPVILRAARNMLNELLGESGPPPLFTGTEIKHVPESTNPGPSTDFDAADDNAPPTDTRVDTNGVTFDAEFCGNAAKPFYGSGKRSGQWKKRQGVDEAAYDAWYAEQLKLVTEHKPAAEDAPIATADAFGGQSQPASTPAPEDCGGFMGWVSAKQAADLLTQTDIGEAYQQAGIQVTDLFPPNDEGAVKANVSLLYRILVVKAGA